MNGIGMKEKKSFHISQNSMCHCIHVGIQANHWTQIFSSVAAVQSCFCFIIVAAAIVLYRGIVSVVCSIVLSKGSKPIM